MPIIKNKNIFITGYPCSGKTTLFNEIINYIKKIKPDITIYGFTTKEIRDKGDSTKRKVYKELIYTKNYKTSCKHNS